jgi:hypothetical protein
MLRQLTPSNRFWGEGFRGYFWSSNSREIWG